MKTRTVLLILILALMVVSCIPSLYPLYREKDLVLDERLIGKWDMEGGDYWEFEKLDLEKEKGLLSISEWNKYESGKTYKLIAVEISDEDTLKQEFAVHMTQLDDKHYLDFYPVDYEVAHDFLGWHLVPAHIFVKIEFIKQGMVISYFDPDFLEDLIEQNKIKISHTELDYRILLTAQTKELQKFVMKYTDEPEAFGEHDTICRMVN